MATAPPQRSGKAAPQGARAPARPAGAEPEGQVGLRQADEAVATILAREAYTRERHYLLVRVIMGLLLLAGLQGAANIYLATRPPQYHYFSTDRDGRITPLTPIDRPIASLSDLGTWVSNSVAQAYTFDFANYRSSLSAARVNFTQAGWAGFETALQESGVLQSVLERKYVTTAVPTSAPVLVTQGRIEGRYAWKFQIPILVTYQSSERTASQNLMVNVIVVRQPETEHPRGLGIAQLIAQ